MHLRLVVGLDISQDTFDAGYFLGTAKHHKVFQNSRNGFKALLAWLAKLNALLCFCMEATGDYGEDLATFLYDKDHEVFVVNPRFVKKFAESEGIRCKTDKDDAFLLARYCTTRLSSQRPFHPWKPLPQEVRELRELTRYRFKLVQTKESYRLRLQRTNNQVLREQLKAALALLQSQLKDLDNALKQCVESHVGLKNKVKLLTTIDGIGLTTAATILAEVPFLDEFKSKGQLVKYAGLEPCPNQSGTSLRGATVISKQGNKRLRVALYMPAVVALRYNQRCQAKYLDLLRRGKKKMQAVAAIMRQLLCFVYGVLRSGRPWEAEVVAPKLKLAS